ncbi:AraC family transcriptional regulator [Pantoea sp. At-9b]|jgi:hypothetical protein|uniref:AraC family transcriptional regulator n=1 Tax=Pantoea sp. (strain At-9b) TaxID=592316 RepID=UPI00167FC43A|nr:AraC family transcriptional regulator [Pantoea sp. At-9b]
MITKRSSNPPPMNTEKETGKHGILTSNYSLFSPLGGVLRVITTHGSWTLGHHCGLLSLDRKGHELYASGEPLMNSVYIEPDVWSHHRTECCVLMVTSLLSELILEMVKERRQKKYLLSELIVPLLLRGLLEAQELQHGCLPLPEDRCLQKICKALMLTPSNNESLEIWGDHIGTSDRTLSRLFIKETGYTIWAMATIVTAGGIDDPTCQWDASCDDCR